VSEPAVRGSEGASGEELGHTGRRLADDRAVPWRVFLAIALIVAVMAAIYWVVAHDEYSGVVLLALTVGLTGWVALYLWLGQRGEGPTAPEPPAEVHEHYLPHASVWPFAIGLGAATLANGLVLGLWVIVPGAALMAFGFGGFVRQTRRRD
jgi:multisubunit Na+/H+ antiporter MnhC subunit